MRVPRRTRLTIVRVLSDGGRTGGALQAAISASSARAESARGIRRAPLAFGTGRTRESASVAIMKRQTLATHERRITPGPPRFGMSRQNTHEPHSSRRQPSHSPHRVRLRCLGLPGSAEAGREAPHRPVSASSGAFSEPLGGAIRLTAVSGGAKAVELLDKPLARWADWSALSNELAGV